MERLLEALHSLCICSLCPFLLVDIPTGTGLRLYATGHDALGRIILINGLPLVYKCVSTAVPLSFTPKQSKSLNPRTLSILTMQYDVHATTVNTVLTIFHNTPEYRSSTI